MPKKFLFESAKHHLLTAARTVCEHEEKVSPENGKQWAKLIDSLEFEYPQPRVFVVRWSYPGEGKSTLSLQDVRLYFRGDNEAMVEKQREAGMLFQEDSVERQNRDFFLNAVVEIGRKAGLYMSDMNPADAADTGASEAADAERFHAEEVFHDEWAHAEEAETIDVRHRNEACTAPEMRWITQRCGDLNGKTLLDIGCGLGEASVYFALQGADVTGMDISQGMCDITEKLAERNGVKLNTHKSTAEAMGLPVDQKFDVIYCGNLLHHVDIETTIDAALKHLKPDGLFVSWDPVAYNPIINVYRKKATDTRTVDEHPLTLRDIRTISGRFEHVEKKWFWLTTLLIFMVMAVFQKRDPNKERYWKVVIDEADRWKWLYLPLEWVDKILLTLLPFLRPLCWNVAIVGTKPIAERRDEES